MKDFRIPERHIHQGVAFGPGQEDLLVRHWGFSQTDLDAAVAAGTCVLREPEVTRAAKGFAREHGIDLFDVVGTGSGGRITKADVETYHSTQSSAGASPEEEKP